MTDEPIVPLVTPPSAGLDPMISLATSLHASPGVYALLLGSGVSTAAGIPTGWQIVTDLVRRTAAAKFPDDTGAADAASADPEAWWLEHGDGEPLGYSGLLESLASTPAARHALLAGYFEPTPEELEAGLKAPGAAHRAVAQLVARGTVRVVLTTNFDRLLERALEALGVQPQVLHRPEQIAAATPLRHHRATIIKLHGDYADLDKRNTIDELQTYPPETQGLLRSVLDEYGLLVTGWSADWDVALAAALEETRSRRYPLFWSFYGSTLGETARRLVAQQGAVQLGGVSADQLFGDVLARIEALDRLSDPPISRAMAVSRLKRALPDPVRRIELYDLVDHETAAVVKRVQDQDRYPLLIQPLTSEALDGRITSLRGDTDTLLHLLVSGVFHDVHGVHDNLWVRVIERLMSLRDAVTGGHQEHLEKLRHFPAELAACVAGMAGVLAGRNDVVGTLFRRPQWRSNFGLNNEIDAATALNPYLVIHSSVVNSLPRWSGRQQDLHFPQSHLLRADLREPLRDIESDDTRYTDAFDHFELLVSLVSLATSGQYSQGWWGEVALRNRWSHGPNGEMTHPAMAKVVKETSLDGAFWTAAGISDADEAKQLCDQLIDELGQMRKRTMYG